MLRVFSVTKFSQKAMNYIFMKFRVLLSRYCIVALLQIGYMKSKLNISRHNQYYPWVHTKKGY